MVRGTEKPPATRSKAKTHFAPVERMERDDLLCDIRLLGNSPFVDGVMQVAGGMLAILNEQRQILMVNDAFVRHLGIEDTKTVFGLRVGEALACIHAQEEPGGCGTSSFCASCGAVIATMAALSSNKSQQRECVATVQRDGKDVDFCFLVHCIPIHVDQTRYLLLFLQDVTVSQNRATLEAMFFHDVQNMVSALSLNTRLLSSLPGEQDRQASQLRIQQIAGYLDKEVEMQRVLVRGETHAYGLEFSERIAADVVQEVRDMVMHHPAASGKRLIVNEPICTAPLVTDISLLRRVLFNMLINAYEATRPGHALKLTVTEQGQAVSFEVWNEIPIPESIALRVFQRNFSTKEGSGRGMGTYTMKLFGESYLGGKVSFTSSATDGTVFRFILPKCVR